ncbi:hypothetical protein FA15DRAFT_546046, partial [Coprinopsis marcescibilis]
HPFDSDQDLQLSYSVLAKVQQDGIIPCGYDLLEEEWPEDGYPVVESVKVARKQVDITLLFEIWFRRAALWVQGLHSMSTILY